MIEILIKELKIIKCTFCGALLSYQKEDIKRKRML